MKKIYVYKMKNARDDNYISIYKSIYTRMCVCTYILTVNRTDGNYEVERQPLKNFKSCINILFNRMKKREIFSFFYDTAKSAIYFRL